MCWLLVALLLFSADSFRLTALFYAPSCKTSSKSRHLFAAPTLFAAPPFQSQFEKALSIPVASVTTDRIININPSLIDKKAIAERLQINSIIDLSGTIKLSNANKKGKELKRRRDDTSAGNNIRVVGDVLATITQRCVRTGELFDEAIVITFNNVVVGDGTSSATSTTDDGIPSMPINRKTNGNSKKTAKALLKRGVEGFNEGFDINNNSMTSNDEKLDQIISNLEGEGGGMGLDMGMGIGLEEDDICTDPDVYENGTLKLAELLVQYLGINLSPYPKKPGSSPINLSFGDEFEN